MESSPEKAVKQRKSEKRNQRRVVVVEVDVMVDVVNDDGR